MAMFSTRIATGVRHLIRPSASSRKVKAASAALPPQTTQSAATITVTGWHPVQPFSTMSQTTASTATSSHGKSRYSFLLYAPDYTDEGCLSRRLAVRSDHLAGAVQLKQKGQLQSGGAMVSPDTYSSDQKKMIGSVLVYEAENIEAVRELVEQDIYYKSDVWDKEKLVIVPYVAAPL